MSMAAAAAASAWSPGAPAIWQFSGAVEEDAGKKNTNSQFSGAVEEDAAKKNTNCVYSVASLLTCKKAVLRINEPFGPDLLQFSGDQNSSKMSFLQMLEETEVGKEASDDPFHLKLPILEEQPDQKNFSHSPEISTKSCKIEANPQSEENDDENAGNENCSAQKTEKFAGPANSGHRPIARRGRQKIMTTIKEATLVPMF